MAKQLKMFSQGFRQCDSIETVYNEDTANVSLVTDMLLYVRKTWGMVFGRDTYIQGTFHGFGWSWDQFVGTRPTPIRMPRPYIEQNKLISSKIFTEQKIMEQVAAYPGVTNRIAKKLREGTMYKIGETNCDKKFVAMNPSDRSGYRANGIDLIKCNENLAEAYLAFIAKGKSIKGWVKTDMMVEEFQERYPDVKLFKEGMNVYEQFLAHLDSAGAFFNRACELYDVKGLVNLKETYVNSFDFEEQIRAVYGNKVKHYFDDILKNKKNAINLKMVYQFNTKKV